MKVFIKAAEIIDSGSPYNKQVKNILVQDGKLVYIGDEEKDADTTISGRDIKVSPGWIDMRVSIKDPGFEYKEDIISVAQSAAFGGFTEIAALPNTKPVVQSKDVIAYIKQKSRDSLVTIHPTAAVTIDHKGEELTEMIDLHHAGAIAFSEGNKPLWHTDVALKTLQYLQTFNGILIEHAEDKYLSYLGQMNEGPVSTNLGLKGNPKLSEELMVQRDLKLLEYTGGAIHFSHISSPGSIEMIYAAKMKGLNVSCDIAAHYLVLDDGMLESFDTNLKVNPPLRTKDDIIYFWEALLQGKIDFIVSDHNPQDEESKNLEFDLADFGIIGLETVFPLINTYNRGLSIEAIVQKLAIESRKIFKLKTPVVNTGEIANLTVFDPSIEWVYSSEKIKSKSANSPFVNHQFKGKVLAVVNNNQVATFID
ncbi:MAG: dihydroorotase [Cytophagaceae bacterium]